MRKNNTANRGSDLKRAFRCLTEEQQEAVKVEILEATGWSESNLRSKLNGTRGLKKIEIRGLKPIFEAYDIEL